MAYVNVSKVEKKFNKVEDETTSTQSIIKAHLFDLDTSIY